LAGVGLIRDDGAYQLVDFTVDPSDILGSRTPLQIHPSQAIAAQSSHQVLPDYLHLGRPTSDTIRQPRLRITLC
jgi:hypothetical protein